MPSQPRILIGGIQHETNTFSPVLTGRDRFRVSAGPGMLEAHNRAGTELGGAIARAQHDALLVPAIMATATPSGMVSRGALEDLTAALCAPVVSGEAVDGALIVLHGAMVAEGADEADAAILSAVRERLGPDKPLVVTLDFHANISEAMIEIADMLVVYRTFPHTDMAERGAEAMNHLLGLINGAPKPHTSFRKLPLQPSSDSQVTDEEPMRSIFARLAAGCDRDDVTSASVAAGFPYADVAHLGASVLVHGKRPAAEALATELAGRLWAERPGMAASLTSIEGALAEADTASGRPTILVDAADNVGGGAPGDGTAILAAILERGLSGALVILWDPASAARTLAVGQNGRFTGAVGGHTQCGSGTPLPVSGVVRFAGPVTYRRTGSYMRGTEVDLGPTTVLDVGGNTIVLTSERLMPFDTDHLAALDIDPRRQRMIVVKSGNAWRAAFGELAGTVIHVDAPGVATQNLARLPYTRAQHALYPVDRDRFYDPA